MGKRLQDSRLRKPVVGANEITSTSGMARGLKRLRPWLDHANLDVDFIVAQPQVSRLRQLKPAMFVYADNNTAGSHWPWS